MQNPINIVDMCKNAAPNLFSEVNNLSSSWLDSIILNFTEYQNLNDKNLNDPVWGTITLYPWESVILDSSLVQRLRGVKQLGLAHLVFPSASHDRFSHVCGVVEASDRIMSYIIRNSSARSRINPDDNVPIISDSDRYLIRLAALIHDAGHGPFSHAIEPVLERIYRIEISQLRTAINTLFLVSDKYDFSRDVKSDFLKPDRLQFSEAVAVLIIVSNSFQKLLSHPLLSTVRSTKSIDEVTSHLISAIVGGSDGSTRGALASIVSSQIDADKLDYMARDAHHAGLPIEFDTDRLISKIELIRVEESILSTRLQDLKNRVREKGGSYYEIGISSGGTGALEQMLVGRVFLYDRLYHHHKVRAADAMAQRLVYYSDPQGRELKLDSLYASIPDELIVRGFGGLPIGFTKDGRLLNLPSNAETKELSNAISSRQIYVRAFAFAGRFVTTFNAFSDIDNEIKNSNNEDAERQRVMDGVNSELIDFEDRIKAEFEIAQLAREIGSSLPVEHPLYKQSVDVASHHIIVDLPKTAHQSRITVVARSSDGRLDVPDVFYDPARWAAVYATQRRTGYVFTQRERRELVSLAAKVWFLRKFGCVLSEAADRHAKINGRLKIDWLRDIHKAGKISEIECKYLEKPQVIFVPFQMREKHIPQGWLDSKPNFLREFNEKLNKRLPEGMPAIIETELRQTLRMLFRTIQTWASDSSFCCEVIRSERHLQTELRRALRQFSAEVSEGSETAGGETDLIVNNSVTIEVKLFADPTDNPFAALPNAGLQARRYALPTNKNFAVTVVGYRAKTEAGCFSPVECVQVLEPAQTGSSFAEVRLVVRHSDSKPSRAGRT